ncbi:MAG: hypothetical protein JOZ57_00380 [Abitibacteriaceae bacterium]|nr:hypothetical protein [Abditibacteriaceae bacterium]
MEIVFSLVNGISFLVLLGLTLLLFLLFLRFTGWLRHSYQQAKHMRQQEEHLDSIEIEESDRGGYQVWSRWL